MLTGRRDQATTANLDSAITYDVAGQREPPADSTGIGSRELGHSVTRASTPADVRERTTLPMTVHLIMD
jgi:hypothetical protein